MSALSQKKPFSEDAKNLPKWPNNGIDCNRWFTQLPSFVVAILRQFYWGKHKKWNRVKYLNIRIDTRNGNFLVFCEGDDGKMSEMISPDDLGLDFSKVSKRWALPDETEEDEKQ